MNNAPSDTRTYEVEGRAPQVVVVDLPLDLSAADTAQLIEDRSGDFYLLAVVPWPGFGARAFFRKHAITIRREKQDAGSLPLTKVKYANPDGLDDAADAIIRRCPKMPPNDLADKLAQNGIVRTAKWVYARRKAIQRAATAAAVDRSA